MHKAKKNSRCRSSKFNRVLLCISYRSLQRHQQLPCSCSSGAAGALVSLLPRQQLTSKGDCKPKPGEQLNHSWQKGWEHSVVSIASPVFLIRSVLLTWPIYSPYLYAELLDEHELSARTFTSPEPFNISLQKENTTWVALDKSWCLLKAQAHKN